MKRFGMVIRIKEEMIDRYKELHDNPWPEVVDMIRECNIRNYSIYMKEGYLFSYFDYHGHDFEADMKKMADDPMTQKWWKETDPCQEAVATAAEGEWWSVMEEVFHMD